MKRVIIEEKEDVVHFESVKNHDYFGILYDVGSKGEVIRINDFFYCISEENLSASFARYKTLKDVLTDEDVKEVYVFCTRKSLLEWLIKE